MGLTVVKPTYILVAVDPGVRGCAVAVFGDGVLLLALKTHSIHDSLMSCALAACEPVEKLKIAHINMLIIEKPQVYDSRNQRGDQRDIIDLALVVGAVIAVMAIGHVIYRIETPLPHRWKGNVPKNISKYRARAKLTDVELDKVGLFANHDVWDAIALGQWGLETA